MSNAEWTTIRVQLLVFGCPSKAIPKRYVTLRHRLAVLTGYGYTVPYPPSLGWVAQWLNENNLVITHHGMPNRYVIGRRGQ